MKMWEALQLLFFAMSETKELVVIRLGTKTRVLFTSSPRYASMPPDLHFVYAVLALVSESIGMRVLIAAPNRELERKSLRLLRSKLDANRADISLALRGFYDFADILIVLDENL